MRRRNRSRAVRTTLTQRAPAGTPISPGRLRLSMLGRPLRRGDGNVLHLFGFLTLQEEADSGLVRARVAEQPDRRQKQQREQRGQDRDHHRPAEVKKSHHPFRHVQIIVCPPGWLMTRAPAWYPLGQEKPPPGPGGPCGPVSPFGPAGPGSPFAPAIPCSPFGPAGPAGPRGPVATLIVTVFA